MKVRNTRIIMILSYLVLIAVITTGTFFNAPESVTSTQDLVLQGLYFSALKLLPLLLFIPGLISGSHYAASWLSYMTMLYFVLTIAFGNGGLMWLQVLSIMTLFMSSMLYTRWKKAEEASA
ncbi:MAG: DUF2069 domain-containing protein [Thalassolituus sp.]